MKTWLGVGLLLGLSVAATFGQGAQADQIKRRARNLADQNNAQQGVPTAAPPKPASAQRPAAPPPPAAPAMPPPSPQQKSIAALRAELASLVATNSAEMRKRLSKSLLTAARGAGKPTGSATDQLGENMATAMVGTKLSPAQLDRLAQNLDGVVNSGNMPKAQTDAIADDVKSVLEKTGGNAQHAAVVADDLKRVAGEIQKAASK